MFLVLWRHAYLSHTRDQFDLVKILEEVMFPYAKNEMPLKMGFNKITTPNTPINKQQERNY